MMSSSELLLIIRSSNYIYLFKYNFAVHLMKPFYFYFTTSHNLFNSSFLIVMISAQLVKKEVERKSVTKPVKTKSTERTIT